MIDISCKCITYGRVSVLEEALYSFINQEYGGNSELVIVNDYPLQFLVFDHPRVKIINLDKTFKTIGEKENFAVSICQYDNIAVWDDDDIALPNHCSNINKYLCNHDLLHWNLGGHVDYDELKTLTHLGNSGIVYTKDIWLKCNGYPQENDGYDMKFVLKIRDKLNGSICHAHPKHGEVSWFYMWGGRSFHLSGSSSNKNDIVVRHSAYIERMRREGKIPTGRIELQPRWNKDYKQMLVDHCNGLIPNK
jgi:hypothetical protein